MLVLFRCNSDNLHGPNPGMSTMTLRARHVFDTNLGIENADTCNNTLRATNNHSTGSLHSVLDYRPLFLPFLDCELLRICYWSIMLTHETPNPKLSTLIHHDWRMLSAFDARLRCCPATALGEDWSRRTIECIEVLGGVFWFGHCLPLGLDDS